MLFTETSMTHARFGSRSRAAFVAIAALLPFLMFSGCAQTTAGGDPPAAETLWLQGNGLKLKTTVYESAHLSSHPVLVVVLHGDLLGFRAIPPTTYHYVFADQATKKIDDVVVAAVLRPGYRDHTGQRSDGNTGLATGDNYTPEVVDAVAGVIDQLKAKFHPSHTVLMGHSGGSAITADFLGRVPSAVDGALVISCPCDLGAWRAFMMKKQGNAPIWTAPIHALSPLDLADSVSPTVHVAVLVGADDDVAPPWMSSAYADALKRHVSHVTLTTAPGLGHEILLEPVAYDALKNLVQELRANDQG
jgi:pimeloyl-ACP methyl ester carboxylesterase